MKNSRKKLFIGSLIVGLFLALSASIWAMDMAKVGNRVITDQDIKASTSILTDAQQNLYLSDSNNRRNTLLKLMDQEVLMQMAEKQKLDQDLKYQAALTQFKRMYLASALVEKEVMPKVSESALKQFYQENAYRYHTDRAMVQHILVENEDIAREIVKKASGTGVDFQELADKHSIDPSVKNNRGDLGWVGFESPYVDEFKRPVLNAKEGQVVGPIKTQFGYHIVKILKKVPGQRLEFYEVEMRVRNDLKDSLIANLVMDAKKTIPTMVNENSLQAWK